MKINTFFLVHWHLAERINMTEINDSLLRIVRIGQHLLGMQYTIKRHLLGHCVQYTLHRVFSLNKTTGFPMFFKNEENILN